MVIPKIHAWAWGVPAAEIPHLLRPFDGRMSAILYPHQYEADVPYPVAYVAQPMQARDALNVRQDWRAFIVGDEPNLRQGASEYAAWSAPVFSYLRTQRQLVSTAALAMQGSWWRELTFNLTFPDDYHAQMPRAHSAGFNAARSRIWEVRRVLGLEPGLWIPTAIPYRNFNNYLLPLLGMTVDNWVGISWDDRVLTLGVWCLKTGKMANGEFQTQFGIYDERGRMTRAATQFRRALELPRSGPE